MAENEKLAGEFENILKRANNNDGARNLLAMLFPKAEQILKTYVPSSVSERRSLTRSRRLSEKNFSQAYFSLDPQAVGWTRDEIEKILNSENPFDRIIEAQRKIDLAPENDRSRLRGILLDALSSGFDQSRQITAGWLKGFVKASPYFIYNPDEDPSFFGFDNAQRMRFILVGGVEYLNQIDRYKLFLDVIQDAQDLTLLSDFVRSYTPDRHLKADKDESRKNYFGEHGDELRSLLLNRIMQMAESQTLLLQADPGPLLWFWWSCDKELEVKQFTSAAMESFAGLRVLMEIPISLIRSSEGNYEQVAAYWSNIVDLDELKSRARLMLSSEPEEKNRKLAERFLAACERGEKERL